MAPIYLFGKKSKEPQVAYFLKKLSKLGFIEDRVINGPVQLRGFFKDESTVRLYITRIKKHSYMTHITLDRRGHVSPIANGLYFNNPKDLLSKLYLFNELIGVLPKRFSFRRWFAAWWQDVYHSDHEGNPRFFAVTVLLWLGALAMTVGFLWTVVSDQLNK